MSARSLRLPLLLAGIAMCGGCRTGIPGGADAPAATTGDVLTRASYQETIRGTPVTFDMVWVPGGGFWMSKTEVTWDEFLSYCDFGERKRIPPGVDAVARPSKPLDDVTPFDRYWGLGKRPAVGVSWNSANQYCAWLSLNTGHTYRLPTEAEWELACGAAPAGDLGDYAWFEANSDESTHEVAAKLPNEHGLFDMLGNLWEYCANPYSPDEPKRAVLRGGSWSEAPADVTPKSRLGFEDDWVLEDPNVPPGVWWVPDGDHLGFRVLRPAVATTAASADR